MIHAHRPRYRTHTDPSHEPHVFPTRLSRLHALEVADDRKVTCERDAHGDRRRENEQEKRHGDRVQGSSASGACGWPGSEGQRVVLVAVVVVRVVGAVLHLGRCHADVETVDDGGSRLLAPRGVGARLTRHVAAAEQGAGRPPSVAHLVVPRRVGVVSVELGQLDRRHLQRVGGDRHLAQHLDRHLQLLEHLRVGEHVGHHLVCRRPLLRLTVERLHTPLEDPTIELRLGLLLDDAVDALLGLLQRLEELLLLHLHLLELLLHRLLELLHVGATATSSTVAPLARSLLEDREVDVTQGGRLADRDLGGPVQQRVALLGLLGAHAQSLLERLRMLVQTENAELGGIVEARGAVWAIAQADGAKHGLQELQRLRLARVPEEVRVEADDHELRLVRQPEVAHVEPGQLEGVARLERKRVSPCVKIVKELGLEPRLLGLLKRGLGVRFGDGDAQEVHTTVVSPQEAHLGADDRHAIHTGRLDHGDGDGGDLIDVRPDHHLAAQVRHEDAAQRPRQYVRDLQKLLGPREVRLLDSVDQLLFGAPRRHHRRQVEAA